jgi:hypothetical protein
MNFFFSIIRTLIVKREKKKNLPLEFFRYLLIFNIQEKARFSGDFILETYISVSNFLRVFIIL